MQSASLTALRIANFLDASMRISLGYAERLVKDIPADKFANSPHANMNHPAFCIGHLSLYPNRMFTMLGRTNLVVERPGYLELFQAGVACVVKEGHYPGKDELVSYFFERYRSLGELLPNIPDEALQCENPIEGRLREMFPTVGSALTFMLGSHLGIHLGQISAWRRAVGMSSAM